ncbi:hypothetical protein D3C84_791130 [compost metagenome]
MLRGDQETRLGDQRDYLQHAADRHCGLDAVCRGAECRSAGVRWDQPALLGCPALPGTGGVGGRVYRLFFAAQALEPDHFVVCVHHFPDVRSGDRRLV